MINLYHLLDAATGQLFGEPAAVAFPDFCADIRRLEPGQLYAALPTELGDGHRFIGEALARGAAGVVCVDPPAQLDWTGVTCVVVHDIRAALLQWAVYALQRYGTTVIALAGADTAVAREAVARVLRTRYRAFKSSAPCRTRDDLPLALGRLEPEDQFAILELAGDVAEIVAVVGPMVGVVTGIAEGEEHRAGAYRALVEGLPPEGLAVLNYDDGVTRNMAGAARAPVLTFGLDTSGMAYGADLLAYNIKPLRYRTAFDLRHDARRYLGRWIPLLGTHQLYGVLAGMLVGLAYEISIEEATQALTDLTPIRGRLCPLEGAGGSLLVDDTHDATVESTLRALAWLEQAREPEGRLIFVMGGIEAAGWARQNLRALGRRVGGAADVFVAQGHMAAQVGRAAVDAGMDPARVHVTFSPADSVEQARAGLGPHDVVLVKGGASARMDQVVRGLLDDPARDAALVARPQDAGAGVQAAWRPSWVEVDLDAVAHNVRRLKAHANQDRAPDSPEVALMVVVRANAYGHGAAEVGTTAALNGADYLGVGSLEEGVRLREAGVDAPILVLGYTPGWMARQAIVHGLTVTLFDRETARAFDRAAGEVGATARVHVKVDTGLGRLGLPPDDVARFFRGLHDVRHLEFEGLYTHLADADTPEQPRAREQLHAFRYVLSALAAAGIRFRFVHAANTAAIFTLPEARFTLVRAGLGVYGLHPSEAVRLPADFRPVMQWKTQIVQIRAAPPGSVTGFGEGVRTDTPLTLAIIPVGYADGLRRGVGQWAHALVRGARAPLVGAVGMDLAALDVTHIPDAHVGDEVVLLGQQGEDRITAGDAARWLGASVYEVVAGILPGAARGR